LTGILLLSRGRHGDERRTIIDRVHMAYCFLTELVEVPFDETQTV
jgi:hypothetical protein